MKLPEKALESAAAAGILNIHWTAPDWVELDSSTAINQGITNITVITLREQLEKPSFAF